MDETIGFVGVGNMGSRMARNLLEAGYDVTVFDLDETRCEAMREAGAGVGDSPRDVAEQSTVVFSSLPTADAIEAAYLGDEGIVAGAGDGHLLVEMSTTKPSTTEKVAAEATANGANMVDAPVIGTPPVAAAAELTLMVGGPDGAFERVEPLLEVLGETVWHVGDVGDGHRSKLVNNALMHGNFVVAAEALALAKHVGLDQQQMFDVIDSGMGGSDIVRAKASKAFEDDFDPEDGSPIDNARKDVKYALELGYESGFSMHVAAAVEEHYNLAATVGEGEKDYSVLMRVLEELSETDGLVEGDGDGDGDDDGDDEE
jgi:2-hydroxy-3-oxopropionate reductase